MHDSFAGVFVKLGISACVFLVTISITRPAAAQVNLALQRFDSAPAGDSFFGVDAPPIPSDFSVRLRATFDWAHNPLVLREVDDDTRVYTVVRNQVFANVGAAFEVWKRLTLTLDLPVAIVQSGPDIGSQALPQPSGAHIGDLRIGARVLLLAPSDKFRLSVGGFVYAPIAGESSASGAYVSDDAWRGRAEVIASGTTDRLLWSVAVGPEFRSEQEIVSVRQDTALRAGAGIAMRFLDDRSLQIGPEASTLVTLSDSQSHNWNFEALLGARYRECHGFEAGVGAGPGLTIGVGTPDFRVVAMLGYGFASCPKSPPPPVVVAAPPPPPPDRDGDGILDVNDACPDVAGVSTSDPATHGCPPPPDRDGDNVIDANDACPETPGRVTNDPATNGCPPPQDTDGDTIVDPQDACPTVPGMADANATRNGCPIAQVINNQIVALDQIQFETGSAAIKAESIIILEGILASVNSLPATQRFRVEGHTDNRGSPAKNKRLSQKRAEAVVKWLAAHGVDKKRFEAKGFGQERPLVANSDDAGRRQNRRVEIHIIDVK